MDIKPASGHRIHFTTKNVTSTPVRLVGADGRYAVVFVNTGDAVRIGHSGSIATEGVIIPQNNGFSDTFSADEWWAYAASGTGTVSGYIIV